MSVKTVKKAGNALSSLYHKILYENGVTAAKFEELLSLHKEKVRRGKNSSHINIGSYKGNLKKELLAPKMTWLSFIKGLKVINPVSVEFTVKIKFRTKETVHSVEVNLDDDSTNE